MKPRCGRKLETRRLSSRVRDYDFGAIPVCGLAEGHEPYHNCVSEESLARSREKRRLRRIASASSPVPHRKY